MKSLFFCLLLFLFAICGEPLMAQTDSLSTGDTLSLSRQHALLSVVRQYRYHLASNLTSKQVVPLLKRSSSEEVQRYIRRYRFQRTAADITSWLSFPLLTGGVILNRSKPELGRTLWLIGIGSIYVPLFFRPEYNVERAVENYNIALRTQSADYYQPSVDFRAQSERLTLADTVAVKDRLFRSQFYYRGIRVEPSTNLKTAFEYLHSGRVTANLRYVRTVRRVTGFVSSVALFTLSGYLAFYAAYRTTGRLPLNQAIVYPAASLIGVGILANWHTNRIQSGTMQEYNQKLKEKWAERE